MVDRKTFTIDSFLGVDFTTSPLKVHPKRAVAGKNFLSDYGTMKKRPGWIEKYKFTNPVTAMHHFKGAEEFYIVRSGNKFYRLEMDYSSHTTLFTAATVANENVKFFDFDGKVYIIGCGMYLVMTESIEGGTVTYTISEVRDNAYIPTTTISIDDTASTVVSRASHEEVNLLTIKRKNSLIGRNATNLEWLLDSNVRQIEPYIISKVYVDIEYIDDNELKEKNYETFPELTGLERYLFDKDEIDKIVENAKGQMNVEVLGTNANYTWEEVTAYDYQLATVKWNLSNLTSDPVTVDVVNYLLFADSALWDQSRGNGVARVASTFEDTIVFTYWKLKVFSTVSAYGGYRVLKLYEATEPTLLGADNIVVTYESADVVDASGIYNATQGIIFGIYGTTNQLFLASGAREHYSKAYDFTYFPDTYVNVLGNTNNPIVGYDRLSDTGLVIYKDSRARESRLYFRTVELVADSETTTTAYRLIDKAIDANIGCDAPLSIENLTGDHLFMSHQGVYAITLGENVSVESRHARERSLYINKKLASYTSYERTQAKAIVFDNMYYLAIGSDVFVADAKIRTASDMDDTFNYEWYFWNNIPVGAWLVSNNQLHFGSSEGRVCVFDDKYSDRTLIRATEGDVMLTLSNSVLVYNSEIPVKVNDEIKASVFELLIHNSNLVIESDGYKAQVSTELMLYEGMEVYIDNITTSGLAENTKYYITNYDEDTDWFQLSDEDDVLVLPTASVNLLVDLSNTTLYIKEHDPDNNNFSLKKSENGNMVVLANYNDTPITFVITIHEPVEMIFYTPIFDLGSNMVAKTLLGMTISADASTTGAIEFGFDTRNISSNIQSLNFSSFTFDDIDFNNFTFLTAIASSYTVRTKEKDFNFIIMKVGSRTPTSAVINNITILYKYGMMNRGIR